MTEDIKFRCYRKHIFGNQNYLISFTLDKNMNLTALKGNKTSDHPKYIIPLKWSTEISWDSIEGTFSLNVGNKFKQFYCQEFKQLKKYLSKFVAFTNFKHQYFEGNETNGIMRCIKKGDNTSDFAVTKILKTKADIQQLYQELDILSKLNHQNLPIFEEFYSSNDAFYIVLNYLQGQTLEDLIKESKFTINIRLIQHLISECIQAILYLNSLNIIHRNIEPSNILFEQKTKEVKLIDFKYACFLGQDNKIMGKPGYIAPEILQGGKCCYESDLFSLGCIFYKLMLKKDLFIGQSQNDILNGNSKCLINYQHVSFLRIQPSAQKLLKELLNPDPRLRINTKEVMKHFFFKDSFQQSTRNINISQRISSQSQSKFQTDKDQDKQNNVEFKENELQDDYFSTELPPMIPIPIMNFIKGGQRENEIETFQQHHIESLVSKSTG